MKILHVIKYLSPGAGGPVTSLLQITNMLVERGHDVTILTTDHLFNATFAKNFKNVEIIPVHCVFRVGGLLYSPEIHTWLSEHISDFDVVHLHEYRSYQNSIVSNYVRKYDIPYIIQARGSVLPFFEKKMLKYLYDIVWGNKLLKHSSMMLALTEEEAAQYKVMGVPEEKITIIPNGIDLTTYNNRPDKGLFKEKNQIPQENKVVLYLGRIHKIKGIDLLVEAFSDVQKEVDNITLVIVGPDGGSQHELVEKTKELGISDSVIFTGPLYGNEKISAYIDADVYVLPSVYEAFPNTVLEAWAYGTPVIISESCTLSTKIAKEQAGIVVKRDPVELTDAIQRVLEDDALRESIIARGRALVEGEYNIESVINRIEDCYQKIVNHNYGENNENRHN